ncbi:MULTISPECIES: hypothetical protein [Sneathiella]|jgi:hypothetical protein|uniref:hypothetical protein n=1 Tax=Sneathiella TaxID=510690 RepID=UPI00146A27BC|nr:hypothetical protein [Sneathiella aquimaris]
MSYGLGLSEKKRARERRNRFLKTVFYLALLSAAGAYGYFEGQAQADRRVANVEDQVKVLSLKNQRLTDQTRDALEKQNSALAEARGWRHKFEQEIPTGATLEILELVKQRVDEGLDPERLITLIGLAQNQQNCDPTPETKRFIVNTPIYTQIGNSISLADGSITVTGNGISTLNAEGKPEAWYDPAKPVSITFTKIGGKSEKVEGVLPIHKSVVFGGKEYRFSILSGKQSFASISATRCDFP